MSFNPTSKRVESLNAFRKVIHHGTHGLIRRLSIDLTDDNRIVVRGSSPSYYGVQLAIHTMHEFADAYPRFPETQFLLDVDGAPLEFVIGSLSNRVAAVSQSLQVADVAPS